MCHTLSAPPTLSELRNLFACVRFTKQKNIPKKNILIVKQNCGKLSFFAWGPRFFGRRHENHKGKQQPFLEYFLKFPVPLGY